MSILIPSPRELKTAAFRYIFLFVLLTIIGISQGQAQNQTTSTTKKTTDGTTPAGLEPGAPLGSYALSGFDNINLFSQSLNFRLPLMKIGGRGSAGYQMMLPIERKWHVDHKMTMSGIGCQSCDENIVEHSYMPNDSWWNGIEPGYGPGILQGRNAGSRDFLPCSYRDSQVYKKTLTRLTFITPDGTEYELRDTLTNGQPLNVQSCTTGPNRGKVFVSTDGTSVTFVSDSPIEDYIFANDYPPSSPSGYLLMSDGMRYRIDAGQVSWIRDRNGNTVHYYPNVQLSDGQYGTRIVDSLNREVTVTYANTTRAYDEITYKGFSGASRVIRIWYGGLSENLRPANAEHPAELLSSYLGLFPLPNGQDAPYDPKVISRVELPDASLKYRFYYNSYGELARVELPTGGAFEYDYQQSSGLYDLGGDLQYGEQYEIFRQVVERRVYNTGNALEIRMTYGGCQEATSTPTFNCVEADQRDPADSSRILQASRHYFYGSPLPKLAWYDPLYYTGWNEGKEYKTEEIAAGSQNVLRRLERTWQQRAPVSWWTSACCLGPEPSNDPRVVETITTLADTNPNKVSKQSAINPSTQEVGFDQYNNLTDTWEYDFGDGAPGALLRRTHTDFLTVNSINGKGYDALILNNSNLDLSNTIHLRSLPLRKSLYDANGAEEARTTYEYDNYASDVHHAAILTYSSPAISGMDAAFTSMSGTQARGNVTATTQYLISNNSVTGAVATYQQYDVAGNLVKMIDPLNHVTTFEFTDRFGVPDNEAESNSAPSELSGLMTFAFATKAVNALGHTAYTQFDYYLGKAINTEDVNQGVFSSSYDDLLDRPTQAIHYIKRPSSNPVAESRRSFIYDNTTHTFTTTGDQITYGDNLIKSQMLYDGLGRTIETRQYETATSYIAVKQIPYILDQDPQSNLVMASRASNPYRPADESPVYTTTYFDALGRVTAVKSPDNAIISTSYSGSLVLVADQASKQRLSQFNAVGQLTDVWEITPNEPAKYPSIISVSFNGQSLKGYLTHYEYDPLDDLTRVTQGTQQPQRIFAYNSLKQLTEATNPESGHVSYEYDAAGNLRHKTDARHITTTYDYDELNRLKSKTYNDAGITPSVFYKYDGQALQAEPSGFDRGPSTGRLVAVLYGNESSTTGNYQGYDASGRIKCSYQVTYDGTTTQTYGFPDYQYDLAGNLKSQTYPSGRVVTTDYDRMSRISSVTGSGRSAPYGDSFAYAAQGAVKEMKLGNGLWEHTIFNNRLQAIEISVGTQQTGQNSADKLKLAYSYETFDGNNQSQHDNNGNMLSQTITIPAVGANFTATQTYTYDALNRLDSAKELNAVGQTWKQVYNYDRYGNRIFGAGTTIPSLPPEQLTDPLTNPVINPSNNQLDPYTAGQANIIYDAAGNLTRDVSGHTYGYDGENRQTKYDGGNPLAEGTSYTYDGEGRRVRKATPTETTVFVYNALDQMVAEYSNSNQPADNSSGGTSYLTADNLGSPRIITGTNLNDERGGVRARHDYLPFGGEIGAGIGGRTSAQGFSQVDNVRQHFTGKERDSETGLDWFSSRYYSSAQGRFISPDYFDENPASLYSHHDLSSALPYATLSNPQTLNMYTYAYNNPLSFVDPDGHVGKLKSVPGAPRYKMRVDRSNINDSPNIHIFDKGGRREIGRLSIRGEEGAVTYEWSGKVPESVKTLVEDFVMDRNIQPRPSPHGEVRPTEEGGPAGEAGGTVKSNIFMGLVLLDYIIQSMNAEYDRTHYGYYIDPALGVYVIDDPALAARSLGDGFRLTFYDGPIMWNNPYLFEIKDGHWITHDPRCSGCTLIIDKDGKVHVGILAMDHSPLEVLYGKTHFREGVRRTL